MKKFKNDIVQNYINLFYYIKKVRYWGKKNYDKKTLRFPKELNEIIESEINYINENYRMEGKRGVNYNEMVMYALMIQFGVSIDKDGNIVQEKNLKSINASRKTGISKTGLQEYIYTLEKK